MVKNTNTYEFQTQHCISHPHPHRSPTTVLSTALPSPLVWVYLCIKLPCKHNCCLLGFLVAWDISLPFLYFSFVLGVYQLWAWLQQVYIWSILSKQVKLMNFFSGRVCDAIYKYTLYDVELSGIIADQLLILFKKSYSKQALENFSTCVRALVVQSYHVGHLHMQRGNFN